MSRMGRLPVVVPESVQVVLDGANLTVKGKYGELSFSVSDAVAVTLDDDKLWVKPVDESRRAKVMWGTTRSQVNNLVTGVDQGFTFELRIEGVGYRAAVEGKELVLQLGYSHEIRHPIPDGVEVAVENQREIKLTGADKQQVSQLAAVIRRYRPPEPYKGKGIRHKGEHVRRKEGKKK